MSVCLLDPFACKRTILCICLNMVLTFRCAVQSFCSTSWAEAYSKSAKVRLSQAARYLPGISNRRGQISSSPTLEARQRARKRMPGHQRICSDPVQSPWPACTGQHCAGMAHCADAHLSNCSIVAAMPSLCMRRRCSYVTPRSAGRSDEGTEHGMAFVVAGVFH